MSGSAYLNAPSYLPMLLGSGSSGNSLLAILHGAVDPAPGTVSPAAALEQARATEAKQVALSAADPRVRRDIMQFTQALAVAETPVQLLADPVALKVLLTANGLADQAGDMGLATRALLSDSALSDSLVNTLADLRWLSLNRLCSFAGHGLSIIRDPMTIAALSHGYAEALWRANPDQATEGWSNERDVNLATPGLAAPTALSVGLVV